MATRGHPRALPVELWIRVLEHLNQEGDLPHLWTSCRHVSTSFRAAVEFMFREHHLSKTWICYDLGILIDPRNEDENGGRSILVDFTFSHLSDDKTIAYFFFAEYPNLEDYKRLALQALRRSVMSHNIEEPKHYVQIRRDLNDTPAPSLKVDYEKMELSCDWRGLYSAFYSEEKLYQDIHWASLMSHKDSVDGLRVKIQSGQLDLHMAATSLQVLQEGLERKSEDARKIARRARIRRQFKELDGTEWEAERDWDLRREKYVMKSLAQKALIASWEQYSDCEAEEDEMSWEDEDDEDEWD